MIGKTIGKEKNGQERRGSTNKATGVLLQGEPAIRKVRSVNQRQRFRKYYGGKVELPEAP